MRNNDRMYRENDRYVDRFGRDTCGFNHDCDYDDEDYDYCENAGDSCTGNTGNGNTGNGNCGCNNNCGCETDDNQDLNGCICFCYDNEECCHDTIHCSDRCDYNTDERYGCNVTEDAANSEDNWFDYPSHNNSCFRNREVSEQDCRFCKKLLCRIQVLDFALNETIQYLNTHPCDCEALRYYCQIRRKLEKAELMYERKCGPLTSKGVDTEYGWEWATCPWPWEGR